MFQRNIIDPIYVASYKENVLIDRENPKFTYFGSIFL